ncbi:MAG: AhpC/TSA family protein [Sphingobacteriaceae bacterium]|nr:MAG: AhpC/TSA family protein [Sphingobacteriaceae bacterium]
MKHLNTLIAILIFSTAAFAARSAPGYTISGTVTDLDEGTWLYLRTAKPDVNIDSCQVKGGKFWMHGEVHAQAMQVYLHTAKYTNYVSFWLENALISISVTAGSFKKAVIRGSKTQDENNLLNALQLPLTNLRDSLTRLSGATKDPEARKALRIRLVAIEQQEKQLDQQYVREHPRSLIAAYLLSVYAPGWGKDLSGVLYSQLSQEMKATGYGQQIHDFVTLNRNLKVGDHYADFEQENTAGQKIKASTVKGKYVLLDFWASWCGPCREDNPGLVKTYNRFKDKGFAILGISLDDSKASWLKAVRDDGLVWPNVSDLRGDQNRAALIYGISFVPNNFLVNEQGIIIATNLRGQKLDDKLEELFAPAPDKSAGRKR